MSAKKYLILLKQSRNHLELSWMSKNGLTYLYKKNLNINKRIYHSKRLFLSNKQMYLTLSTVWRKHLCLESCFVKKPTILSLVGTRENRKMLAVLLDSTIVWKFWRARVLLIIFLDWNTKLICSDKRTCILSKRTNHLKQKSQFSDSRSNLCVFHLMKK